MFEHLSTLNFGPSVLLRLVRAAFLRVVAVLYRVLTDIKLLVRAVEYAFWGCCSLFDNVRNAMTEQTLVCKCCLAFVLLRKQVYKKSLSPFISFFIAFSLWAKKTFLIVELLSVSYWTGCGKRGSVFLLLPIYFRRVFSFVWCPYFILLPWFSVM